MGNRVSVVGGDRDIMKMQLIGSTQIYEKQVIYNEK